MKHVLIFAYNDKYTYSSSNKSEKYQQYPEKNS